MSGSAAFRRAEAVSAELCIQFVTTVAWRLRNPVEEGLPDSFALLDWLNAAGLANKTCAARLKSHFTMHPVEAGKVHRRAVELREAIYQLLLPEGSIKTFS